MSSTNQLIRLHQDQAAFTSCIAFLQLTDIIQCLQVCHHWRTTLTTENQYGLLAWSSCTYTPERQLQLPRVYHPFIRSLHLIQMAHYLTVDALAAFTHLTSFSLQQIPDLCSKPDASADWEQATPQGLNTLFGLAPTNTSISIPSPAIHYSPIISFHLNWYRNVTHRFPLQGVLENPRFASLTELSILRPRVQPKEAILAIGRLKELTKLTCHVQFDQRMWNPNLIILFEVIHQLPLLHTLNVDRIPEGIVPTRDGMALSQCSMVPLPSTITDLTISDLNRDPTPLFPALSSLTQVLKLFTFGTYKPSVPDQPNRDWSDFMKWLSEVKTLEVLRISLTGDHLMLNLIQPYLLTTQLSIRLIRSHEGGISEMEFTREVNSPPLETKLPLVVPQPPLQSPKSEPFTRHPLQHFRDWPMQSLKELYLVNLPLTSTLMDCLSHLSSATIEHLELTVRVTESVTPVAEVVTRFCEFLGQQTQLRTLVLHGRWIHQYSSLLSGSLVHCQELRNVQLNSAPLDCDGGCTFNLAEVLSRLPHLAQLHLRGPCLGHITSLKVLVTSDSLHQLDCVLFSHPNPAMDFTTNTQYLLSLCDSYPHIRMTVNGQPIRRMANTLAKKRQKSSSSKRCCQIQ